MSIISSHRIHNNLWCRRTKSNNCQPDYKIGDIILFAMVEAPITSQFAPNIKLKNPIKIKSKDVIIFYYLFFKKVKIYIPISVSLFLILKFMLRIYYYFLPRIMNTQSKFITL